MLVNLKLTGDLMSDTQFGGIVDVSLAVGVFLVNIHFASLLYPA